MVVALARIARITERAGGGLNAREYQQMANQQVYLHATEASDAH